MKIHEYNEMMRHLTRREPSDKHLAAMPLYEQGGRVGYQSGQLVQPGPGRQGYNGEVEGIELIESLKNKKDKSGRPFISDYKEKLKLLKELQKNKYLNPNTNKPFTPKEWLNPTKPDGSEYSKKSIASFRSKFRDPQAFLDKKATYQKKYTRKRKIDDPVWKEEQLTARKEDYYSKERKKWIPSEKQSGRGVLREQRNKMLHYMSTAAQKGNANYTEIIKDGKFLGVTDNTAGINYYEEGYKGKLGSKSKLISSHPDFKNIQDLTKLADKFKRSLPNKAIQSYFSSYGRVPKMGELYNYLVADPRYMSKMGSKAFTDNPLQLHHKISMVDSPTQKFQLLLKDKNNQAGVLTDQFKKGIITKDKLNTELKKINARAKAGGWYIGAKDITPEQQVKVAKTQTTKLFNKMLKENPKQLETLAKMIAQGPDGIKFLNKQAVAQTMAKAIDDKGIKVCSSQIVTKAEGGRIGFAGKKCNVAFATNDPVGYMAAVKKDKEALNAFKSATQSKKGSDILKAARWVMRETANPVGWIGGELLISGGITAAMLGEGYTTRKAIDDGLAWFLPKSVLKSRLNEIEEVSKKEGVDFETVMPFLQLETIADEHEQQKKLYLKNTDPLHAWSLQNLYQISNKMFGKKLEDLTKEEFKQIPMPSASGRGGKFYRQQAIESTLAGMEDATKNYENIVKNLKGPFEEGSTDWVLPGVLKQELENIADMSQTERAKANQLKSLKKTYDKGVDLTVEGQRFIDKDISFEDWVHQKGKGDLFFNEFQRGPDRREFLTYNLFNPVKEEPYKMEFPGRDSIDFSAVPYAIGGRVGLKKGKRPFSLSRRGFLQWLAGITGAGVAAGTGFIKLGKGAKTVAPKVTEEVIKRSADGMPTYIDNLISVVQSKGVKKLVDSNVNKYPDTLHTYKGVEVTQDATGNIKIAKDDYTQRNHMQIEKGQMNVKDEGLETQKSFQEPDEYIEGTVRPDRDGKMKDFEEGLDADVHKQFKKIADEGTYDTSLPDIDDID